MDSASKSPHLVRAIAIPLVCSGNMDNHLSAWRFVLFVFACTATVGAYAAFATSVIPPFQQEGMTMVTEPVTLLTFGVSALAFPLISRLRHWSLRLIALYVAFVVLLVGFGLHLHSYIPFTSMGQALLMSLYSGHWLGVPPLLVLAPLGVWLTRPPETRPPETRPTQSRPNQESPRPLSATSPP